MSVVEARREAEEKRNDKHRQMEAEREAVRQGIRDKVAPLASSVFFIFCTCELVGNKVKTL